MSWFSTSASCDAVHRSTNAIVAFAGRSKSTPVLNSALFGLGFCPNASVAGRPGSNPNTQSLETATCARRAWPLRKYSDGSRSHTTSTSLINTCKFAFSRARMTLVLTIPI